MAGVYVVNLTRQAVTAAITLIQIKAGATTPIDILEARVSQSSSTTSTQLPVQIMRKSAAATVTSATPLLLNPGWQAADAVGGTTSTGINASGEGTDTDILVQSVWNYLSEWVYSPVPEARIRMDPATFLGLKFPVAPGSSVTITASITFMELV